MGHFDLKGLAQCTELCLQLRGEAEKRQVPNAKLALQHNLGLGGAAVVALYKMGFGGKVKGIFAFKVKKTDGTIGTWIVDAKNGSGSVEFEGKIKPTKGLFSRKVEDSRKHGIGDEASGISETSC